MSTFTEVRPFLPSSATWEQDGVLEDQLPAGWRRHGRQAHRELIDRWLGVLHGRWLKTDLQEERSALRSLIPVLGGEWFGVDVATSVVSEARDNKATRGVTADVRHLPFRDGGLDGVLSTSTLDHFDDVTEIGVSLHELRRVLAPDGRLVLTLDNPQNPLIWLRNHLPTPARRATGLVPFHVGPTLSARAGAQALEQSGFEVLAVEHLLHAPHVVGTRAARWRWFERRALPWFDRLSTTSAARYTGHFVAFLARPRL